VKRELSHTEISTAMDCQAKDAHLVEVRRRRAAGESIDDLAREFGVHRVTIYAWLRQQHAPRYVRRGSPFWDRVAKAGPDECWEWQTASHPAGYGQITVDGCKVYAHRRAYELVKGPIPTGAVVRHTCDNPPCCNPAHLLVGSVADNVRDAVERGRNHRPAGELHGRHKFSDALVARARELGASGMSNLEVAAMTGISPSYVCRLLKGTRR
jgi:transposase